MEYELGKNYLAIRPTYYNKYVVVECKVSKGYDGEIRKYSHAFDTKYKTIKGAEKSLKRWLHGKLKWKNYIPIGLIGENEFTGELHKSSHRRL